jgi:cell division protease FtsH
VDLEVIARGTPGFSGADLENLVNEAALYAAKRNKDQVDMSDFEEAKDKVLMGKERKSVILSEEEKRTTAFHEAGHALVAKLLPGADPVHKVTIIPRGMALGVTQQLPVDDRHNYSKTYLENSLAMLMGGRVAEELVLQQMTTGASNDIERATKLARNMVCLWGMSEKLGPLSFGDSTEQIFLGKELIHNKNYSEDTSRAIDEEVRRIVESAHDKARTLISGNLEVLNQIAKALLERETLSGDDIDLIIKGEPLPQNSDEERARSRRSAAAAYEKAGEAGPEDKPAAGSPGSDEFLLEEGDGRDPDSNVR